MDTSWNRVAAWYEEHLKGDDTYHAKVVLPNAVRMLNPSAGDHVLDIACGTGYFTRAWQAAGAIAEGIDLGPALIKQAQQASPDIAYEVGSATALPYKDGAFSKASLMLAIQNIDPLEKVFAEAHRVLASGGELLVVMNHPVLRIPQVTSWGFDVKADRQYRRIDGYLRDRALRIQMHPGKDKGESTTSFHRPLSAYLNGAAESGFTLVRCEEWTSHRTSEAGPRRKAEDEARKEFPLFMALLFRKH